MLRPLRAAATVAALSLALVPAGCGDDEPAGGASATKGADAPLVVSAAASLKGAFTQYGEAFDGADVKLSFAGSDALAAQIRQGARPDVFAAANTKLPDELFDEGLVDKPVVFAGNRLVLAVPASGGKVKGFDDLDGQGVKLAIGSDSVPIGAYTRKVLGELPAAEERGILANVGSDEPDVKGIVGKLTQGAVDAGFVYITDVQAAGDELKAIELPGGLNPSAAYGVAVVKGAEHPEAAKAFVDGLITGAGQQALEQAGFEPPPGE